MKVNVRGAKRLILQYIMPKDMVDKQVFKVSVYYLK